MPTILLINGFRFFFFSDEGSEPCHIHIKKGGARGKIWLLPIIEESTPKTPKIKKVSFGDLFTFFNSLILRHQRISKNENLLQNNSFLKIVCFRSGLIINMLKFYNKPL